MTTRIPNDIKTTREIVLRNDVADMAAHTQFGKQRMMVTARQAMRQSANAPRPFIDMMVAAVHQFVGDAEQSDDLTMLAVTYNRNEKK